MDQWTKETWSYDGDWETQGTQGRRGKRSKKSWGQKEGSSSYCRPNLRKNYPKNEGTRG